MPTCGLRCPPVHRILPNNIVEQASHSRHEHARQQHQRNEPPPQPNNLRLRARQHRRRAARRVNGIRPAHYQTRARTRHSARDPTVVREEPRIELEELADADSHNRRERVAQDGVARLRERGPDRVIIQHGARAQTGDHDRGLEVRDAGRVVEQAAHEAEAAERGDEHGHPLCDGGGLFLRLRAAAQEAAEGLGEDIEAVVGDVRVEIAVDVEVEDVVGFHCLLEYVFNVCARSVPKDWVGSCAGFKCLI